MATRTLVIGDVHGCLIELNSLLRKIAPAASDHLIFLGDLIDRGPDSAGVLNCVIGLAGQCRVTTIMGNHEQMMLEARTSNEKRADWLTNGGDATLRSNGPDATLADVPASHWDYLVHELTPYVETKATSLCTQTPIPTSP